MNRILNAFDGRGTPVTGQHFVGRTQILKDIQSRISSRNHVSLVGLPRIGKTSLVKQLMQEYDSEHLPRPVYLSLDTQRGPASVFAELLTETIGAQLDDIYSLDHDRMYRFFKREMKNKFSTTQSRTLIVIDELDHVLSQSFDDAELFLARIRELACDFSTYGLTFLLVSRRPLDVIQGQLPASNLSGICSTMFLEMFSNDEANEIIGSAGLGRLNVLAESVTEYCGFHPYLISLLLWTAVEHSSRETDLDLDAAYARVRLEFHDYFGVLWSMLESETTHHINALEVCVELTIGPRHRNLILSDSDLLIRYGIINAQSGREEFETFCKSFTVYLDAKTRSRPAWNIITETERRLRALVEDVMTKKDGVTWIMKKSHDPKFERNFAEMDQKRQREFRLFGESEEISLLDFSYIADLDALIMNHWNSFAAHFRGNKLEVKKSLEIIANVRNPLAHARNPPERNTQIAIAVCGSLFK